MIRIVIAPDKFKGCLSAADAAAAIAVGLRTADPSVDLDLCPVADGGEGTVDALVAATGGRKITHLVTGPLPQMRVNATFGLLGDGRTAVIEMSSAAGLHLLQPEQRNPMNTTTYGTGELLNEAARLGPTRIILGIGGSATTDAGLGCAQACGAVIRLEDGRSISAGDAPLVGRDVARVMEVQTSTGVLASVEIVVASDVTNPLYGPSGAAAVFGPQKGASSAEVSHLDAALKQLAQRLGKSDVASSPGAGAAGGLGFGMMAFYGAKLRSGVEIVMETVGLRRRLEGADLCITAEGKLDAQSLAGKAPIGVARLCREQKVPCIALAGTISDDLQNATAEGLIAWFSICPRPMTLQESMTNAPKLLADVAENLLRSISAPSRRFTQRQ